MIRRIRTVKPEFFDDRKVCACPMDARYLFVGILTHCDDNGIATGDIDHLRSTIFMRDDDVRSSNVRRMVDDLSAQGLVHPFTGDDGNPYLWLPNFQKHQKIDKAKVGKLRQNPMPECGVEGLRRQFDDNSANVRRPFDPGKGSGNGTGTGNQNTQQRHDGPGQPVQGGGTTADPSGGGEERREPRAGEHPQGEAVRGDGADRPGDPLVAPLTLTPEPTPKEPKPRRKPKGAMPERVAAFAAVTEAWNQGPARTVYPEAHPEEWEDERNVKAVETRLARSGIDEIRRRFKLITRTWGDFHPAMVWFLGPKGWDEVGMGKWTERNGHDAPIAHRPYPLCGIDIGMLSGDERGRLTRDTMVLSVEEARRVLTAAVREHEQRAGGVL